MTTDLAAGTPGERDRVTCTEEAIEVVSGLRCHARDLDVFDLGTEDSTVDDENLT